MPQFHCGEKHEESNQVAKNCISSCCFIKAYGAVRNKKKDVLDHHTEAWECIVLEKPVTLNLFSVES